MRRNHSSAKFQLNILTVIIILDVLSATMTVPLFPLIIGDADVGILGVEYSNNRRVLILGWLFGLYGVMQFVGAPIVGSLSDKYGRKKIIAIVFCLNIVQYLLIAVSIIYKSLWLLVVTRILTGLAGGTMFVEQSAIADMSTKETKAKNMGIVGIAWGIGLILGPMLGTVLSNNQIVPWFNLSIPFIAILFLNSFNLFILFKYLEEPLKHMNKTEVDFYASLKNIKRAFVEPQWRGLFLVVLFSTFGLMFFMQFLQIFLMEKFEMGLQQQGIFLAYAGLWMVISQGPILRKASQYVTPKHIIRTALPMMALGYYLLTLPNTIIGLYLCLPLMVVCQGLSFPSILALISNKAELHEQGQTIGINQSVQSLAGTIPALLGAGMVSRVIDFPMLFGAMTTLVAFFIFALWARRSS